MFPTHFYVSGRLCTQFGQTVLSLATNELSNEDSCQTSQWANKLFQVKYLQTDDKK